MLEKFGGFEKFCERWWRMIEAAMEKSPGSRYVLSQFNAIVELHALAEEYQREDDARQGHDVTLLSDEELEKVWKESVEVEACRILQGVLERIEERQERAEPLASKGGQSAQALGGSWE